jgi:hypothetical protein
MRRILVGLAVTVVAASLVATAGAAERFERHTIRGEGMSLAVPASWVAVDATLPAAALERLRRENPRLSPYLVPRSGSRAKFLALDPSVKGGFATNVNVVVSAIPSVTFDVYRAAILSEIRSLLGSAKVSHRTVKIGGVRGVRLSYRFRVTFGRTYTVSAIQYGLLRPGKNVVVTYTTLPRLAARYAPTFARSAASIRFR